MGWELWNGCIIECRVHIQCLPSFRFVVNGDGWILTPHFGVLECQVNLPLFGNRLHYYGVLPLNVQNDYSGNKTIITWKMRTSSISHSDHTIVTVSLRRVLCRKPRRQTPRHAPSRATSFSARGLHARAYSPRAGHLLPLAGSATGSTRPGSAQPRSNPAQPIPDPVRPIPDPVQPKPVSLPDPAQLRPDPVQPKPGST
ncbi:hypothetical protein PIB30_058000 [Stylosanthes scabra]|uniref:Uncharacterized protein n=1 Tax=Stylosanthes scabra TaxID=79078 RepID=A0ABU6YH84_9FABA|nr:hypothetical protein [Stylosanthes scabra]